MRPPPAAPPPGLTSILPASTRGPALTAVKRGDRVAQLILEQISTPEVIAVDDLDSSDRGAGGFGSTGVNGGPMGVSPPPTEPIG